MTPSRPVLLAFIVFFGFAARAATYRAPLLDHHAWRQADTAGVARSFVRERYNILYPQVDARGGRAEGYVETGLELFAFLVATVSLVAGFHYETGRLLATLCFVASSLLVWTFVRQRDGDRPALAAAFLYAFGFPLALFIERAFMNEALLICLSLAALAATQRYLVRGGRLALGSMAVATTLVAMVKLPYLIVWAPMAGLVLEHDGQRAVRRWELWGILGLNGVAAWAWYSHAQSLGAATGLSFGLTDKLFDPATVFSLDYPALILHRLAKDILGPIGLVGVAVGTLVGLRRGRWCEVFGVAGFVVYLVVVSEGNVPHDYYQLAIMPVAPLVVTLGLVATSDWLGRGRRGRDRVMATLLLLAALSTLVRSVSAHSWYEIDPDAAELCRAVAELTESDERLIVVGDNNPWLLFCADRRGWLVSGGESGPAKIVEAWQEGAAWAVVLRTAVEPDAKRFLEQTAEVAYAGRAGVVFARP
jgi:hypothetical protein